MFSNFVDMIITQITGVWEMINSWYFADIPVSFGQIIVGVFIVELILTFVLNREFNSLINFKKGKSSDNRKDYKKMKKKRSAS